MFLEDLKAIFSGTANPERFEYKAKEFVFRQGAPVRGLFAVEEGQVRLERYTKEGKTATMHVAGKNECFAEASLSSDIYRCYAVAAVHTRVLLFPREDVLKALSANSDTAIGYIALLSRQVKGLRTALELSRILSARERILQYLILAADPATATHTIPGTFKDLASQLGLTHETIYRELKGLEQEGAVKREGNCIRIL